MSTLRHGSPWAGGCSRIRKLSLSLAAILCCIATRPCTAQDENGAQEQDPSPQSSDEQVVEAPAPPPEPIESDGASHRISQLHIEYERPIEGQPTQEDVLLATVRLLRTTSGWAAPRDDHPGEFVSLGAIESGDEQRFFDSALPLIAPAVVERLQELGLIGLYVEPARDEFDVRGDRIVDLRAAEVTTLTLRITTGVVVDMRTNALGDRVPADSTLNNPAHKRVLRFSPVVPLGPDGTAPEGKTSLLRGDALDDYVYFLNRHPGRRVDLAVVPGGEEFGGVSLDYLVTENRPWFAYAQLSNTGTESTTRLRQRFGFVHNQLTNDDDILSIDYLTGNFDEVNALTGSYDRPLGLEGRLRGRFFTSFYTYTAAEVGLAGADFDGEGYSAGAEVRWNLFQDKDLFFDLTGGLRWDRAKVDNNFVMTTGEADFLLPSIGFRAERVRETDRLFAGARFEGNVLGNSQEDLDNLGRFNTDERWAALILDGFYSFYLEPLFADEPNELTPLAHEVVLSGRVQWAIDSRLPPNFQQVAGGLYTVRGYPESLVAGDNLFLGTIEYRYHIAQGLNPVAQPGRFFGLTFSYSPQYTSGPTDWDFILKAFADIGRVTQNERLFFESNSTLVGAGVGLDVIITRHLSGRVDFAWALEDVESGSGAFQVDAGDFEIHFIVTVVF